MGGNTLNAQASETNTWFLDNEMYFIVGVGAEGVAV